MLETHFTLDEKKATFLLPALKGGVVDLRKLNASLSLVIPSLISCQFQSEKKIVSIVFEEADKPQLETLALMLGVAEPLTTKSISEPPTLPTPDELKKEDAKELQMASMIHSVPGGRASVTVFHHPKVKKFFVVVNFQTGGVPNLKHIHHSSEMSYIPKSVTTKDNSQRVSLVATTPDKHTLSAVDLSISQDIEKTYKNTFGVELSSDPKENSSTVKQTQKKLRYSCFESSFRENMGVVYKLSSDFAQEFETGFAPSQIHILVFPYDKEPDLSSITLLSCIGVTFRTVQDKLKAISKPFRKSSNEPKADQKFLKVRWGNFFETSKSDIVVGAALGYPHRGKSSFIHVLLSKYHESQGITTEPQLKPSTPYIERHEFQDFPFKSKGNQEELLSFKFIDTNGYFFQPNTQEEDKKLLTAFIKGLPVFTDLKRIASNWCTVSDSSNALTDLILVINARDLINSVEWYPWIPIIGSSQEQIEKKKVQAVQQLWLHTLSILATVKYNDDRKEAKHHLAIVINHLDMIEQDKEAFQDRVMDLLTQSKDGDEQIIPDLIVFGEKECKWKFADIKAYEKEVEHFLSKHEGILHQDSAVLISGLEKEGKRGRKREREKERERKKEERIINMNPNQTNTNRVRKEKVNRIRVTSAFGMFHLRAM